MVEVGSFEELAALDRRALIDVLKELEVERRRLEGSIARVVAAAEHTCCYAEDGHRSVRGWIMASTNCSLGEALGRLERHACCVNCRSAAPGWTTVR